MHQLVWCIHSEVAFSPPQRPEDETTFSVGLFGDFGETQFEENIVKKCIFCAELHPWKLTWHWKIHIGNTSSNGGFVFVMSAILCWVTIFVKHPKTKHALFVPSDFIHACMDLAKSSFMASSNLEGLGYGWHPSEVQGYRGPPKHFLYDSGWFTL